MDRNLMNHLNSVQLPDNFGMGLVEKLGTASGNFPQLPLNFEAIAKFLN